MFLSLFHSYCLSFYGMELWMKNRSSGNFKKISISYHYALKRILGSPKRFSNHVVCGLLGVLTFEHFLSWRFYKYLNWLNKCASSCFRPFKCFFIRYSRYSLSIQEEFFTKYNITDLFNQDDDAVLSRLYFILEREPSSNFGLDYLSF